MGRPIYRGSNSCYGIKEGVWVRGYGVNSRNAPAYILLILRDLYRGYTYDHNCRIIPMTIGLAKARINYLYPLALKHYGYREAVKVKQLINEVYRHGLRLPSKYMLEAEEYIANYDRIAPRIIEPILVEATTRVRRKQRVSY